LIIVDDGTDPVADLVPDDDRIRYVRLERRISVWAKRNLACERAAGALIANWDDDDWHAPRRLSCQVDAMLRSGAELCGVANPLFFDLRNGQAFRYVYPSDQKQWLAGGTLLFRREFWQSHPYPDINQGEDSRFVWNAQPRQMFALDDFGFYVGIIHDRNASLKPTGGAWWHPHPTEEIRTLLGNDWVHYGEPTEAPLPFLDDPTPGRTQVAPVRNIFACLVHENSKCVVDLVRNLRHLDPTSVVLLYNGGSDPDLLDRGFPFERYGAVTHPSPRPLRWGRLHDFAIDCMRFALDRIPFDTMTIVDSDQLSLRPGYSQTLARWLADKRNVGLLSNAPGRLAPGTQIGPAKAAWKEVDLWMPFLGRFPDGEAKFVHWTFWPSTVFTSAAARDLVRIFSEDAQLREILQQSRIWASEEVILPTLVALLGHEIAANPCSYDYVKHRTPYTSLQLNTAMSRQDVFWAHPIPRRYEDPLRKLVRGRFRDYPQPSPTPESKAAPAPIVDSSAMPVLPPRLLLTLPILASMRRVEGWLEDSEADLLIAATARALGEHPQVRAIVEVGSYCGRGTVVLASVVKAVRPEARVCTIDPHDSKLGAADQLIAVDPSLEKLRANLAASDLAGFVEVIQATAPQVPWSEPIAFLLIDGLHDYANVARDFYHFEAWMKDESYVAFHDYASYFPGVVTFVDELLSGGYHRVDSAGSMIVLQKPASLLDNPVAVVPTALAAGAP